MFHNPMTAADYYKLGHMTMDVPGVKQVLATWTPRQHKHDQPENDYTVNFGEQWFVKRGFIEFFKDFFTGDFEIYADDFRETVEETFNPIYIEPIVEAWRKLHAVGYLPISVWAVPEGYLLADGCPAAMIYNTDDRFGWLPQFLEDLWSNSNWLPSTSATTAYYRRMKATKYFDKHVKDPLAIRKLCGDFSLRGMTSIEAGAISGAGHLLSFDRTATIDANSILKQYYGADLKKRPPGYGLPSLEHSVVEKGVAYFKKKILTGELLTNLEYAKIITKGSRENWEINLIAEACFMIYLLTEVQPSGAFTYVSDTYDYWGVIGKILPAIKHIIMSRDGKLIIRPDSGDPVQVILGNKDAENEWERMGTLESLALIFGFSWDCLMKILDSHIGLIYGDAITAERQELILAGMVEREFSPVNIALGIGAYTYQFVTRDTRGFAIKAVNCVIEGLGELAIFKEPKTDNSKKSQRGAVVVYDTGSNIIDSWDDGHTIELATKHPYQLMRPIFENGEIMNTENIYEIRNRLWNNQF